jgi:hypothetical protein
VLAGVVLSRLDPVMGLGKGEVLSVEGPLPRLVLPRTTQCSLPGGLRFLRVQLPLYKAEAEFASASGSVALPASGSADGGDSPSTHPTRQWCVRGHVLGSGCWLVVIDRDSRFVTSNQ